MEEGQYVVGENTLAVLGGLLGVLTGVISWLLRRLLRAKDEQITEARAQTEHVEHDRDYWRDLAMRLMSERGEHVK